MIAITRKHIVLGTIFIMILVGLYGLILIVVDFGAVPRDCDGFPIGSAYTVQGTVEENQTQKPIYNAEISLRILDRRNPDDFCEAHRPAIFQDIKNMTTDKSGRFAHSKPIFIYDRDGLELTVQATNCQTYQEVLFQESLSRVFSKDEPGIKIYLECAQS